VKKETVMPTKKKAGAKGATDFESITVKQVMEKKVQCAKVTTKGDVIASLMVKGFGSVPVINGKRKLAGIVSEHDLLAAMDDGHRLKDVTAGDVMTGNPYSVPAETTLGTIIHVLRASDLVRVPVVDAQDRLIGIIARRDVLRTYLGSDRTKKRK
jgi:CBS domain-containing protein